MDGWGLTQSEQMRRDAIIREWVRVGALVLLFILAVAAAVKYLVSA